MVPVFIFLSPKRESSKVIFALQVFFCDVIFARMETIKLAFDTAEEMGLSLSEWARRSGVTRETIRAWRDGKDIKLNTIVKLCKPLGLEKRVEYVRRNGKKK